MAKIDVGDDDQRWGSRVSSQKTRGSWGFCVAVGMLLVLESYEVEVVQWRRIDAATDRPKRVSKIGLSKLEAEENRRRVKLEAEENRLHVSPKPTMSSWSWLGGIIGRGSTQAQVYDPILGTCISRSSDISGLLATDTQSCSFLSEMKIRFYIGASAALCGAAWRYYQYRTCMRTYGRDMTASAAKGDPVVGRDDEIERVVRILCRRTKNCAALVGAAGVGKTAIAEGLAQRIAAGRWRGMFEERMKSVIKHAESADGKIILFIDEMHMLIGAGDWMCRSDAANILKPALARGRIRCLGATTYDEYRKNIETDAALERRFQKVDIQEPSTQATIAILKRLRQRYQDHYGLKIPDAAIDAAVHLADRYITGRQFPDKAIDLIDEACTSIHDGRVQKIVRHYDIAQVHMSHVYLKRIYAVLIFQQDALCHCVLTSFFTWKVVSRWTGIPITTLNEEDKIKLIHLADRLHERAVGQNEAVNLVAEAVLRSRAGLGQTGQPIGSFLFLGSTGVGKTELAKALAEQLFDSEKTLVRFDMSEYVCPSSVSRLIGASPRWWTTNEIVRRRPYSVILFDEVEKADRSVLNVFLQVLDDGVLTDGKGRKVDFKNTIIILTSNLGAEHLTSGRAVESTMNIARDLLMKQVRTYFKPKLLNRLSEIVVFEPLLHHQLKEVVNIQMKSVIYRVAGKGISLVLSDAVLDVILSQSYNPIYGARPIKRWIGKHMVTTISKMLVNGEACEGSTISVDAASDNKGLKYQVASSENMADSAIGLMVGDRFGNQSVQVRMAWRRQHPRGGHVSSGSAVATAFAPVLAWSLEGSPGVDADSGLHRRHLEDGTCAGFMVRGYGFLLRHHSRGGVPDLEFDGMSGCCPGLIRSTIRASLLVSHLGGPQSCISAMELCRARVRR
uniref:ATP-dependent Clp protease ATP-binding subunit clpC n=1 Tax=Aegilops tauschii TaxID=37682 RepID=R7WFB2_AEGTA